jgi:TolA-binding protein
MSTEIEKQIQALQAQIEELKVQKERAKKERAALDEAYKRFKSQLKETGLSFDAFVLFARKDIQRILAQKDERPTPAVRPAKAAKKKAARASRGANASRAAKVGIKIPAGTYGNIPPDTETVYQVKGKGARPKQVRAYAEKIGIDAFLERCRIGD